MMVKAEKTARRLAIRSFGIAMALFVSLTWLLWPMHSVAETGAAGAKSTTQSVVLIAGDGAQFELMGPKGQRVLMDVTDPDVLSKPAGKSDVLLTTHLHFDHYNQKFVEAFSGEQLMNRPGKLARPGLSITGIGSHHSDNSWNDDKPKKWSNHIFVIEMAGLRIAHFGDIGQSKLSADQMAALGRVDVAITQFVNSFSQMNLENQNGYLLMDQVRPKIIIPHHGASSEGAIDMAMKRWGVVCAKDGRLTLSPKSLPKQTTVILMGGMAGYMQKTFKLAMHPPAP